MSNTNFAKGEPVCVKPEIIVWRQPAVACVPIATGTYILPFEAIEHLLSHKPLSRPYRGEPVDDTHE